MTKPRAPDFARAAWCDTSSNARHPITESRKVSDDLTSVFRVTSYRHFVERQRNKLALDRNLAVIIGRHADALTRRQPERVESIDT